MIPPVRGDSGTPTITSSKDRCNQCRRLLTLSLRYTVPIGCCLPRRDPQLAGNLVHRVDGQQPLPPRGPQPEDPTTRRTAAPILLVRTQQGVSDGRPDVVEDALPYLVNKTADGVSAVTITVRASRYEPPDQGGTGTYRGQGNRSPVGAEVAVVAGRHRVRRDHGYLTYVSSSECPAAFRACREAFAWTVRGSERSHRDDHLGQYRIATHRGHDDPVGGDAAAGHRRAEHGAADRGVPPPQISGRAGGRAAGGPTSSGVAGARHQPVFQLSSRTPDRRRAGR